MYRRRLDDIRKEHKGHPEGRNKRRMSKTKEHLVRMKGELVVSKFWLIPMEEDTNDGSGIGWVEEIEITDEENVPEKKEKAGITPTKPTDEWKKSHEPHQGMAPKSPWIKDPKKPIGAPIAGMPKWTKEKTKKGLGKGNHPGSSGDKWTDDLPSKGKGKYKTPQPKAKGTGKSKPLPTNKRVRDEEGWDWYPTGKPKREGQQTGHNPTMMRKGKGKKKMEEIFQEQEDEEEEEEDVEDDEEEEEEDEDEDDRYGYILQNNCRVPWDFLLDRAINADATTPKPPPPKLHTVQDREWGMTSNKKNEENKEKKRAGPHVILTKQEIERIVKMMAMEEEEGKKGGKDAAKAILSKYGCMGG